MIEPHDVGAIVDIQRIAGAYHIPLMIIGAGARLLLLDWKHQLPVRRTTKDWDFGVRMKSWTEYQRLYEALTQGDTPFQRTAIEHRVVHTSGTIIDLVPFGEIEEPEGTIQWPVSHNVMTVIGFRDADAHAMRIELAPGVHVRVITIPGLVILKLIAYRDRRKHDDLADVLFILENYSRYELEDRIFDELSEHLATGDLPFDQAAAFLLGRDAAAQCDPSHRADVAGILEGLLRDQNALTRLVSRSIDEETWEKRFALITQLFGRLGSGFLERP